MEAISNVLTVLCGRVSDLLMITESFKPAIIAHHSQFNNDIDYNPASYEIISEFLGDCITFTYVYLDDNGDTTAVAIGIWQSNRLDVQLISPIPYSDLILEYSEGTL